jgi:lipoyl(octanoyl) transferase
VSLLGPVAAPVRPESMTTAKAAPARWTWLGRVPFAPTTALQEQLRQRILAGTGAETLLLLEHHPVITLGRSAIDQHVLVAAGELERRGVELHRASRGGDVTFHGPGQLVGYPVVRLDRGVVGHLRAMADGLIDVLGALGITAFWRREAPGLWIKEDRGGVEVVSKICSFGVNIHRRVAIHGFALNVAVDLDAFRLIVPCGLDGVQMTSIDRVLDRSSAALPSLELLAGDVASAFCRTFGRSFVRASSAEVIAETRGDRI